MTNWIYLAIYVIVGINYVQKVWIEHEKTRYMLTDYLYSDEGDGEVYDKASDALYVKVKCGEAVAWMLIILICALYPITMPYARYKAYKAEQIIRENRNVKEPS